MMSSSNPKPKQSKKILTYVFLTLVFLGIYQYFSFINTPFYVAKFNDSLDAFWERWSEKGEGEEILRLKEKLINLEASLNGEQVEKKYLEKSPPKCIAEKTCINFKISQLLEYITPDKLTIKGDSELVVGSFVSNGINFIGEVTKKNKDGTYEVDTIFNENKKYSVVNLEQTSFGYSNFKNGTLVLNPLSIDDIFEEQDIIILHEYNSKIIPENLILGKVKKLGQEIYIENLLDFHFIKELEVHMKP